jgi:DNA-damage-inducible protein J
MVLYIKNAKNITNIKNFMTDTIIQVRVSSSLKKYAEDVLSAMGLKTSEAIRMFLQQTINDQALPFQPRINKSPNNNTIKSFIEAENGEYSDSSLADFKKSILKTTADENIKNIAQIKSSGTRKKPKK